MTRWRLLSEDDDYNDDDDDEGSVVIVEDESFPRVETRQEQKWSWWRLWSTSETNDDIQVKQEDENEEHFENEERLPPARTPECEDDIYCKGRRGSNNEIVPFRKPQNVRRRWGGSEYDSDEVRLLGRAYRTGSGGTTNVSAGLFSLGNSQRRGRAEEDEVFRMRQEETVEDEEEEEDEDSDDDDRVNQEGWRKNPSPFRRAKSDSYLYPHSYLRTPAAAAMMDNPPPPHITWSYPPGLDNNVKQPSVNVIIKRFITVTLIAILLNRYAPPPPLHPQWENEHEYALPHATWGEYLLATGEETASGLERCARLLWHVGYGITTGLLEDIVSGTTKTWSAYGDWRLRTREAREQRYTLGGACPLLIPSLWTNESAPSSSVMTQQYQHSSATELYLRERIVGQERAVSVVAEALDVWDDSHREVDGGTFMGSHIKTKPLVLVLTGPNGVGKTETARQISQLVFGHCHERGKTTGGSSSSHFDLHKGTLILNGWDYSEPMMDDEEHYVSPGKQSSLSGTTKQSAPVVADEDSENERLGRHQHYVRESENDFFRVIVEHIRKQRGAGAVVVVNHIEEMSPSTLGVLFRALGEPGAKLSYRLINDERGENDVLPRNVRDVMDKADSTNMPGPQRVVEVKCSRVIFIFTSDLGAKRIFQLIRKYRNVNHIPKLELSSHLWTDLELYFGYDSKLRKVINGIAPYMPLGEDEMDAILKSKIETLSSKRAGRQWKSLVVTDAARRHLSREHVDYLEWSGDGSDSTLMTISKHGAHGLDSEGPMKTLRSKLLYIHQPESVVLFDFEEELQHGVLSLCSLGSREQPKQNVQKKENCMEVWRGPLV